MRIALSTASDNEAYLILSHPPRYPGSLQVGAVEAYLGVDRLFEQEPCNLDAYTQYGYPKAINDLLSQVKFAAGIG